MQEKKRHISYKTAIVALCIALLVAAGGLIGILAATSQTVTSTFNVHYSVGDNISAGVRTEYYIPGMLNEQGQEIGVVTAKKDKKGNDVELDENGFVIYNADDPVSEKSVYIGDFTLNPKMRKVIFYFTVKSLMSADYIRVLLTPEYETKNNVIVDTYYYNTASFDPSLSASTLSDDDWSRVYYNNVVAGGYKMIKVVISVDDRNNPASCVGVFDISLNYSSVDGLAQMEAATVTSNMTTETTSVVFEYYNEVPGQTSTLASATEKKIWTYTEGTTLHVCSNYTIDLPADCGNMFKDKTNLTSLDFTNVNTSNVTSMYHMFDGCSNLTELDLRNFNTTNVTDMMMTFRGCSKLTNLDLSHFNTPNLKSLAYTFMSCSSLTELKLDNFDTSNVSSMTYTFFGCGKLTKLDISHFDTTNVTNMWRMFYSCGSLKTLDVSNFNTGKVTSMYDMFAYCTNLTFLDVSGFDTSNVTEMQGMFTNLQFITKLDVSGFNTSKVTNMSAMFTNCKSVKELDVSDFDTSNVTNMEGMFTNCNSVKVLDVSKFNTAKVIDMERMFNGCTLLKKLDLSIFDTSKVTNMDSMFNTCSNLTTIYVGSSWSTTAVTSSEGMFQACSNLVGAISYDKTKIDGTYANTTTGYFTLKTN